ncbi:hypothetical protein BDC45DRAFT_609119 [Circinella umbellata]|nr:hypothetical protein BDC45DRAFT_609119 [Circinella umbellata]
MLVLFLPKLHIFFFQKGKNNLNGKRPDISGRVQTTTATSTLTSQHGDMETKSRELMSINRFLASPNAIDPELIMSQKQQQQRQKKSTDFISSSSDSFSNASTIKNTNVSTTVFEAHEARMPVQVVFRYFPFLSAWDMKHVFLFPRVGYFSFFSEKSQKGRIFGYNRATIESSKQNTYILRVHGTNVFDVLIQVANLQELESWLGWFNTQKNTTPSLKSGSSSTTFTSSSGNTTCLTSPTTTSYTYSPTRSNKSMDIILSRKKYVRNDSGLSARQQLLSESTRQESNITLETIENVGPFVTPSDFNASQPHQQVLSSPFTATSIPPTPLTIPETHSTHNTILNQWAFTLSPTNMENNNDNNNNELENIPLHNIRKE